MMTAANGHGFCRVDAAFRLRRFISRFGILRLHGTEGSQVFRGEYAAPTFAGK
jgi:hypothetical protein